MRYPTVLYVEDDPNDAFFMRLVRKKVGVQNPLEIVSDGEEAIRYLAGEGPYANRVRHPLPDLVLLDLKMPRVTGLDVLRWIRSQPALVHLPVIVFSSSNYPSDINSAHALRIDAYLVKPGRLDEWMELVNSLVKDWLPGDRG
jgi:CheY-like chemotaxis protein